MRNVAVKDYVVKIVHQGEIHIRAKSAEEAASMAGRYGFGSDNFELHVEIARNQDNKEAKVDKKRKKEHRTAVIFNDDIPF